jgi:MFS family permease
MATTTTSTIEAFELRPHGLHRAATVERPQPVTTSPRLSRDGHAPTTSDEAFPEDRTQILSKSRAALVITQLIGLQVFTSFSNGIIVVGLPAIAKGLDIPQGLLLWPTSVFYLAAGSCLMLAGSVCDVIGTRPVLLAANILLIASSLMCGVARTGGEIIAARGLMGISNAMVVPASALLLSSAVPGIWASLVWVLLDHSDSCLDWCWEVSSLMGLVGDWRSILLVLVALRWVRADTGCCLGTCKRDHYV